MKANKVLVEMDTYHTYLWIEYFRKELSTSIVLQKQHTKNITKIDACFKFAKFKAMLAWVLCALSPLIVFIF